MAQSLVGQSGQGHSLPPPEAFGCSLSPHALRVQQVRPPGSPADEIATRSDPKHRGKEGLFKGSKQETGGDANTDTEMSLSPRRAGRLSLCGCRCHPDAQDPWSPPHALGVHLDKIRLSSPQTEVIIFVSDSAQTYCRTLIVLESRWVKVPCICSLCIYVVAMGEPRWIHSQDSPPPSKGGGSPQSLGPHSQRLSPGTVKPTTAAAATATVAAAAVAATAQPPPRPWALLCRCVQ